jgi:hypothetical protein
LILTDLRRSNATEEPTVADYRQNLVVVAIDIILDELSELTAPATQ